MAGLPEYYTALREAVNDAILALDKDKPLVAKMLLKQGQFRAEELCSLAEDACEEPAVPSEESAAPSGEVMD